MSLEQLSDLATIALAVIGVPALVLAADQARHARKARLAAIYLSISKTWDDLVVSRRFITEGPFEWREAMTVAARAAVLPTIESDRRDYEFGEAVYANALWLYERVRNSERFSLPGYGKPALFFRP